MANMKEALTSIDQMGRRIEIIPAEVRGFFRRWRTVSQVFLIFLFLILPWTKVNGRQTVLLDIVDRKFSLFGVQFFAHDGPLIFLIMAIGVLSLALLTALWGRVWCGWGCPQTVFIDAVYRRIERWVEGNYIQRRALRKAPMSFKKAAQWMTKWFLFTVVSSIIAHSFVAYFIGSDYLLSLLQGGPLENWNYFLMISGATGLLLFNFGWFREQFCVVVCPYGRFQSVLMDANSVTVLYDEKRGEPRKGPPRTDQSGRIPSGDCVSCRRCVEVCPTGIDIRNGVQMECIACTSCIDACDEIMDKVKKPRGLIRYASQYSKARFFRPRIAVYLIFLVIVGTALGFNFAERSGFMVTLLRASETPYQVLLEGSQKNILNHFKLHIHNQTSRFQKFDVTLPPDLSNLGVRLTLPPGDLELAPSSDREVHFFVLAPAEHFNDQGQLNLSLNIHGSLEAETISKPMILIGPLQERRAQ
jgi:cytochrome c oxidase accessory protein FixG